MAAAKTQMKEEKNKARVNEAEEKGRLTNAFDRSQRRKYLIQLSQDFLFF